MSRAELRRQQKAQQKTVTMSMEAFDKALEMAKTEAWMKAMQEYSKNAYVLSVGLTVFLVHDHFGELMLKNVNGKSREERAFDIMMGYWQDVQAGNFTLADVQTMLKEEVGVEFYER